ncbi:protein-L-isoaspartate(D-aspartate) O-methyltransferase [Caballeronia sp. dw_276]|jgi:protein-L-isoaspartate(D-aspartate) O-methyltransferase|uniref:protein-L-isoaspartate(D-aspartate) O-methyltransferase n=1 Tax=Caballeronia sp. dw_276 TaxID=2719795 RepID=UPI001BD29B8A|nr:protein-L-isoaspartate(D-aspartate) O-methyltransferase [Caballeronia sp. dw_276]
MTDERAKRFPLALADLVREPRKATARPDASGKSNARPAAKPTLKSIAGGSGAARPAAGAHKAGAATLKPASVKIAKLPTALHPGTKVNVVAKPANVAGTTAGKPHAAPKPSTVVTHHQPGALRSGARMNETRDFPASAKIQAAPENKPKQQPDDKLRTARKTALQGAHGSTHALTSERVRERMVERLRANGITDPRVLAAMSAVPRHMFVDPGLAAQAYEDAALPIGHHQTISKPSVVARMIELVAAGRTLKNVLEIGTGCGYQAAVLSQVATDVYSIERIRPLSERAKLNLRPLRVPNIRLHYGDGRLGLPAAAPFDAIVIACAGLDVPQALLDQLAVGGRLVAPVGSQTAQAQILTLVERVSPTQWRESQLDRVFFVPLKSGVI